MFEIIILAIALSMDAFAVSIGLGSREKKNLGRLALRAGLYFGVFQALMPFAGYLAGRGVLGWVEAYAHWIAFVLLVLVGVRMIHESFGAGVEESITVASHRVMLMLAVATSIDAMAAGFSLTLLPANPFLACFIIGLTTFVFSWAGVLIGRSSGTWLESRAEMLGGIVLILIGLRVLLAGFPTDS